MGKDYVNEDEEDVLVIVNNIPADFHTYDLRRHFTDFVESDKFNCFHFRHRPEKGKFSEMVPTSTEGNHRQSYSKSSCSRVHKTESSSKSDRPTTCCLARLHSTHVRSLLAQYHGKHWQDHTGNEGPTKCLISRVKLSETDPKMQHTSSSESTEIGFKHPEITNKMSEEDSIKLSDSSDSSNKASYISSEILSLPELSPPNIMPRGNVGTSTTYFLTAIKECRMSSKLIGKLKLDFPQTRKRKFGAVAPLYLYENHRQRLTDRNAAGPVLEDVVSKDTEEDNDTCEEWERHEALHNDVKSNRTIGDQVNSTSYAAAGGDLEQQEGTKDIPYENEVELVWEKGGSGLNFYTDSLYWKKFEGDFDEQTTDDWDVDMSVHYESNTTHNKDAVDVSDMRRSDFLRSGKHEESVFTKKKKSNKTFGKKFMSKSGSQDDTFGGFEVHSKGFGSKIMTKQGWEGPGSGLGVDGRKGLVLPILVDSEDEGRLTTRGLGYHEEKVIDWKRPPAPGFRITGSHRWKEEQDPGDRLHRSNPPMYMKYRDQQVKFLHGGVHSGDQQASKANKQTK